MLVCWVFSWLQKTYTLQDFMMQTVTVLLMPFIWVPVSIFLSGKFIAGLMR